MQDISPVALHTFFSLHLALTFNQASRN